MQKKIMKLVARAPDGGKKEIKEIELTYNYFCFVSLYALVSSYGSFCLTFYFSNAKKIKKLVAWTPYGGGSMPWHNWHHG